MKVFLGLVNKPIDPLQAGGFLSDSDASPYHFGNLILHRHGSQLLCLESSWVRAAPPSRINPGRRTRSGGKHTNSSGTSEKKIRIRPENTEVKANNKYKKTSAWISYKIQASSRRPLLASGFYIQKVTRSLFRFLNFSQIHECARHQLARVFHTAA